MNFHINSRVDYLEFQRSGESVGRKSGEADVSDCRDRCNKVPTHCRFKQKVTFFVVPEDGSAMMMPTWSLFGEVSLSAPRCLLHLYMAFPLSTHGEKERASRKELWCVFTE